jgi:hypothetical protein
MDKVWEILFLALVILGAIVVDSYLGVSRIFTSAAA